MPTTSSTSTAATPAATLPDHKARQALALMVDALELIDSSEGGSVAGAHLDLAIHRLREWIDRDPAT